MVRVIAEALIVKRAMETGKFPGSNGCWACPLSEIEFQAVLREASTLAAKTEAYGGTYTAPGVAILVDSGEEDCGGECIACDQCAMCSINGVPTHEHGCPNLKSRWDADQRIWIKQRKCFTCGCDVDADDACCNALGDDPDDPDFAEDDVS